MAADGREHCSSWLLTLATAGTGLLEMRNPAGEVLLVLTEIGRRSAEDDAAWSALERSPEFCRVSEDSSGRSTQRRCILRAGERSWDSCGAETIAGAAFRCPERRGDRRTAPEKTTGAASRNGARGPETYF